MAHSTHILVVEDDREISAFVSRYLTENSMQVSVIENGRDIEKALREKTIDLVLLDIALPGEDGLSICSRLRAKSPRLPIIMLTAKGEETDRISGLESGADDYLAKPFNPRELLARIRAVLRRSGTGSPDDCPGSVFRFDGWRLDLHKRQLHNRDGVRVILTGAEFNLLRVFCERPLQTLSRDQLLQLTQGRSANLYERSIDMLVGRLRRKLEDDPKSPLLIQTIHAAGYKLSAQVIRE